MAHDRTWPRRSAPLTRLTAAYVVVLAAVRLTVGGPESCDPVAPERLRQAAADAVAWITGNQRADGSYVYEYDLDLGDLGGYNFVRHAGVTMSLYQAAARGGGQPVLAAADRALDWMTGNLARRDGWVALVESGRAALGASALMLAAVLERRAMTADEQHDDLARGLGRFLVAMQRDDGGFHVAYDLPVEATDTVGTSRYFPGEALWALARLAHALPGEGWDGAARLAADFVTLRRDEVEDVAVPPLNDHWAAYGLDELGAAGELSDDHADYARLLYGRFALLIRFEAQRQTGGLVGTAHGPERRAAAVGTWVEGQAALGRLAGVDERLADLAVDIVDSAACGSDVLVQRQGRGAGSEPATGAGAWFDSGVTRMDDQQHALSGLLATAELLEAR